MNNFGVITVLRKIIDKDGLLYVSRYDLREGKIVGKLSLGNLDLTIRSGPITSQGVIEKWEERYEIVRDPIRRRNEEIRENNRKANKEKRPNDRRSILREEPKGGSILAIEILVYCSRGSLKDKKRERFFADSFRFLKEFYGEDNVLLSARHHDAQTEHEHSLIIPITEDGKLCASRWIGKGSQLKELQNAFYEKVSKKYGLDRGLENSMTKKLPYVRYNRMVTDGYRNLRVLDKARFIGKWAFGTALDYAQGVVNEYSAAVTALKIDNARLKEANERQAKALTRRQQELEAKEEALLAKDEEYRKKLAAEERKYARWSEEQKKETEAALRKQKESEAEKLAEKDRKIAALKRDQGDERDFLLGSFEAEFEKKSKDEEEKRLKLERQLKERDREIEKENLELDRYRKVQVDQEKFLKMVSSRLGRVTVQETKALISEEISSVRNYLGLDKDRGKDRGKDSNRSMDMW